MVYTNIDLLPQHNKTLLTDPALYKHVLKIKLFMIDVTIKALNSFMNGEFYKFDAQVGETLCQIRAYKVELLAYKYQNIRLLKDNIITALNSFIHIETRIKKYLKQIENVKHFPNFKRNLSIKDYFHKIGCLFNIHEDVYFLILAYFLRMYCLVTLENIPIAMNEKQLRLDTSTSKYFTKQFIHILQKKLTHYSSQFMFQLLDEQTSKPIQKDLFKLFLKISDEGRIVLPTYDVTKIILGHVKFKGYPITLGIKSLVNSDPLLIYIDFKYDSKQNKYIYCYDLSNDKSMPRLIFQGISLNDSLENLYYKINKEILSNPEKIILANAATHPQYSGKTLKKYSYNHYLKFIQETNIKEENTKFIKSVQECYEEIEGLKIYAQSLGCTIDYKDLFFCNHIFCDSLTNREAKEIFYDVMNFETFKARCEKQIA